MNAFRITLLVLLTIVIALMFYAVQVVVPGMQGRYDEFVATQRVNELQQRTEAHRARISQLNPEVESPEVASARSADEESIRTNEQTLNEAEEQSVIAEARRAEEARQARQEQEKTVSEDPSSNPIGLVAGYDAEWGMLFIRSVSDQPLLNGLNVVVRQNGAYICEAVIDGMDAESGQYTATPRAISSAGMKAQPQTGDEVLVSPYMSGRQLRAQSGIGAPTAPVAPAIPAAPASSQTPGVGELPSIPMEEPAPAGLPEVDAVITPVP